MISFSALSAKMPFVPLGSRKRIEVILDTDKERLRGERAARDELTVKLHHGVMAGQSGYRYANHPMTMGPVRGPGPPFLTANKPWTSEEDDPIGPHAQQNAEQAPIGAYLDGSHGMLGEKLRKTRSLPSMTRCIAANPPDEEGRSLGARAKEAANPVSIELNRWKKLADVTKRDLQGMPELHSLKKSDKREAKPYVAPGGLVNFPKYMLFENSHLRQKDLQRFIEESNNLRMAAEEASAAAEVVPTPDPVESGAQTPVSVSSPGLYGLNKTASWGAPRLRNAPGPIQEQWAGSGMPAGRAQRSSNPFRMG